MIIKKTLLAASLVACFSFSSVAAENYIVKFKGASTKSKSGLISSKQSSISKLGAIVDSKAEHVRSMSGGLDVISIDSADESTIDTLKKSGLLEYAYPDLEVKAVPLVESSPLNANSNGYNDPSFPQQVHFLPPSEAFKGASDILSAQNQILTPKQTVGVAVLDSGYYNHQDISFDVASGYDFINRDPDALDGYNGCVDGHGLAVAGIISASINNGKNVSGITNNTSIVPVRVIGAGCGERGGNLSDLIDALNWISGVSVGGVPDYSGPSIGVVNMSLGVDNTQCIQPLQEAVTRLVDNGVSVVVSAGNEMSSSSANAPANCSGVINVGSVNVQTGKIADVSNRGSRVDIAASGEGVPTIGYFTDETVYFSGTSAAAPVVSGIIALAMSGQNAVPNDGESDVRKTVRDLLKATSTSMPVASQNCQSDSGDFAECFGGGIVNANKFVKAYSVLSEGRLEAPYLATIDTPDCSVLRKDNVIKSEIPSCKAIAFKMKSKIYDTGIKSVSLMKTSGGDTAKVGQSMLSNMVSDPNYNGDDVSYSAVYCYGGDSDSGDKCSSPVPLSIGETGCLN